VVILTLSEKTTISNPNYLFEFEDNQSKDLLYFICEDVSNFKYRFNKFVITETATPDNLLGEVELVNDGQYAYTIREQVSSTNLDPLLSGDIVETGKVQVRTTSEVIPTYESDSNLIRVYNG
jgi:hypothetical protein